MKLFKTLKLILFTLLFTINSFAQQPVPLPQLGGTFEVSSTCMAAGQTLYVWHNGDMRYNCRSNYTYRLMLKDEENCEMYQLTWQTTPFFQVLFPSDVPVGKYTIFVYVSCGIRGMPTITNWMDFKVVNPYYPCF